MRVRVLACPRAHPPSRCPRRKTKHENKHNGLNQFECQHCKKTFATKTLCNRHVKTLHEKDQTFNCDMCDFKTYHSTSLTTHREQVHQKLRPHKCEMCEDAFYYKRDLENMFKSCMFKNLLNIVNHLL